jgi:hypothetical protein
MALQTPVFLLQHVEAQSALVKHWPVMNWLPSPLPTFCAPGLEESMAGLALLVSVLVLSVAGGVAGVAACPPAPA